MSKIEGITFEHLKDMGVDDAGVLYWKGKPVMTRRRVQLRWYELTLATLATLATIAQAVAAFIR